MKLDIQKSKIVLENIFFGYSAVALLVLFYILGVNIFSADADAASGAMNLFFGFFFPWLLLSFLSFPFLNGLYLKYKKYGELENEDKVRATVYVITAIIFLITLYYILFGSLS